MSSAYDLLIVGGGINGAGIARDAAGRGLSVVLCEAGDIGGATSSASSKLIHGGLRYLENYEFGLVAESLAEREVMLRIAPHLTQPRRFVLPLGSGMRPRWMIWCGLLLYDTLGSFRNHRSLPGFESFELAGDACGAGFLPEYRYAFAYSDVCVDDVRLTLANARAAATLGADILPRTRFVEARRSEDGWLATVEDAAGRRELRARAIVNAAGPWAAALAAQLPTELPGGAAARLRLVRGSHIVVPRLYEGEHACTLQNEDSRVCFVIPYQREYTLIGTTEVEVETPERDAVASAAEIDYLCHAVARYLARRINPRDVLWTYSGVRPLFDDGKAAATAVTREYKLVLDAGSDGRLPLLSVYGGKLTTYRRLAEAVLAKLAPWFGSAGRPWTDRQPLPGGDLGGHGMQEWLAQLCAEHPLLPATWLTDLAWRHGSETRAVLDGAKTLPELGRDYGGGLYESEVAWCVNHEWAATPDDILWRRTKCGLHMSARQRQDFADDFCKNRDMTNILAPRGV